MKFNDIYYLKRASVYSDPLDGNAGLPLVYGTLTDGSHGIWKLPCIDTVNFVYAYAGSEVLSVGNGNSVTIYLDGAEVDPVSYTFDESNNYEGQGNIATITFVADAGNGVITAQGMGKDDGTGAVMDNVVDILNDFLTVENDFDSSDYEATAKALASSKFTAQSYLAAGVIAKDENYWSILQSMMGSFLGSVYMNGQRNLTMAIDDGTIIGAQVAIIPRADVESLEAKQRLKSIINQCPCNYAYDYVAGSFASHTDLDSDANTGSQGIYGVLKPNEPFPFYWCRDATSIGVMQDIVLANYAYPVWEITLIDRTMKRIFVDIDNILCVGALDILYDSEGNNLQNQLLRVLEVRPDFMRNHITFRCLDSGNYLTVAYLADGASIIRGKMVHDNDVLSFTVGETITGGTSGATAVVYSDAGGEFVLYDCRGYFEDNEQITGSSSGATADVDESSFGDYCKGAIEFQDEMANDSTAQWVHTGDSLTFDVDHYEFAG